MDNNIIKQIKKDGKTFMLFMNAFDYKCEIYEDLKNNIIIQLEGSRFTDNMFLTVFKETKDYLFSSDPMSKYKNREIIYNETFKYKFFGWKKDLYKRIDNCINNMEKYLNKS